MQPLYLFQEVPNTELSWLLFGLVGMFILVIIIGSLTTPEAGRESRKAPRKKNRSNSMKGRRG
jgi:hypothetical protein